MADDKDVGGDAPQGESVEADAAIPGGGESAVAVHPLLPAVPEVRRFDYAALDLPEAARAELQNTAVEIRAAMRRTLEDWVVIGKGLARAKDLLPHGAWLPFLKLEFGFGDRHARNFMAVAEFNARPEAEEFSDLAPSTVAVLATAPDPVRHEVAGRLRRGERPSFTEVRDLAKRARSGGISADGRDSNGDDDDPGWDLGEHSSETMPRALPDHIYTPVPDELPGMDEEVLLDELDDPPDDPDCYVPIHDVTVTMKAAVQQGLDALAADWGVTFEAALAHLATLEPEQFASLPPPKIEEPQDLRDGPQGLKALAERIFPRYVSMFSGIEAALSVVAKKHRWQCSAVCQWDPGEPNQYATSVLANRVDLLTENLGDIAFVRPEHLRGFDVLVGGSPCQAFSIYGLRKGMQDPRGRLTETFIRLATRAACRRSSDDVAGVPVLIWENVPGTLSLRADRTYTEDQLKELEDGAAPSAKADPEADAKYDDFQDVFGSVLTVLAGAEDGDRFVIPRPRYADGALARWPYGGLVHGPERLVAWRVLDATKFGLPQGRKRLFLVATRRGDGIDPIDILFDRRPKIGAPAWTNGTVSVWNLEKHNRGPAEPVPVGAALSDLLVRDRDAEQPYLIESSHASAILAKARTEGVEHKIPTWLHAVLNRVGSGRAEFQVSELGLDAEALAEFEEDMAGGAAPINYDRGNVTIRTRPNFGYACTILAHYGRGRPERPIVVRREGDTVWVRAMMPVEGERIMGVPDGWTVVPNWDGGENIRETTDIVMRQENLRWHVLGNSLPVPVLDWLCGRANLALRAAIAAGTYRPARGRGVVNAHEAATAPDLRAKRADAFFNRFTPVDQDLVEKIGPVEGHRPWLKRHAVVQAIVANARGHKSGKKPLIKRWSVSNSAIPRSSKAKG